MADKLKPAYLISGENGAKRDSALSRLRARAESEGGAGALETFEGGPNSGPDVDEVIGSLSAISLMSEHRYVLADGVQRWRATQVKRMAEALAAAPPDLTVVFVARGAAPKNLPEAVKKAGGDILDYEAPSKRELPAWVAGEARSRGLQLTAQAARALTARLGDNTVRLATELDRIALWAEEGARLDIDEVEELTADTSERAGWTLGDAIIARDVEDAVLSADVLLGQGEAVTPMIYGMATRLRAAHLAAAGLEAGRPAAEIAASLPMAPYPSKLMLKAVKGLAPAEISDAIGTIAELEWWTRGGSDYSDAAALTIAVRKAAGAESVE